SRAVPGADDDHRVLPIELPDHHVHAVAVRHGERLAHDVGANGQLAPAAVHEHGERDAGGAAEVRQLVERRANGAPGVEHVIHDHQVLAVDVPRNVGGANDGAWPDRLQIVAIERDVERTARNVLTLAFLHDGDEPVSKLDAAALDADEDEVICAIVELDDFVRHAPDRTIHRARIEHGCGGDRHGGEIYAAGTEWREGIARQAGGSIAGSGRNATLSRAARRSSQAGTSPVFG